MGLHLALDAPVLYSHIGVGGGGAGGCSPPATKYFFAIVTGLVCLSSFGIDQKKRRRVQQLSDEEGSGSEKEDEGLNAEDDRDAIAKEIFEGAEDEDEEQGRQVDTLAINVYHLILINVSMCH